MKEPKKRLRPSRLSLSQSNSLCFVLGVLIGLNFSKLSPIYLFSSKPYPSQGGLDFNFFQKIDDVPLRSTSHGTMKQQLIEPFQTHPNLAGISVATLKPGELIEKHSHVTMHEYFYVLSGKVDVVARNITKSCTTGCFVFAPAQVPHSFQVPPGSTTAMQMLVIGLTT
jgi:quercetin dioxygenase-like cupin family protein